MTYLPIYLFSLFGIMFVSLYVINSYYAIKLRRNLRAKYPWKMKETGEYGFKFANSICKDWPDVTDPETLELKQKVKLFQSITILMFLIFPVILFIVTMIVAANK